MKTVTLPKWVIEALAALPLGEKMLVAIPVEPVPEPWRMNLRVVLNTTTSQYEFIDDDALFCVPCPLGAVGERVAVVHPDDWAAVVYAGTSKGQVAAYISLTAEPVVKRVGEINRTEAVKAGLDWRKCPMVPVMTKGVWQHSVEYAGGFANQWRKGRDEPAVRRLLTPEVLAWFCRVKRV